MPNSTFLPTGSETKIELDPVSILMRICSLGCRLKAGVVLVPLYNNSSWDINVKLLNTEDEDK